MCCFDVMSTANIGLPMEYHIEYRPTHGVSYRSSNVTSSETDGLTMWVNQVNRLLQLISILLIDCINRSSWLYVCIAITSISGELSILRSLAVKPCQGTAINRSPIGPWHGLCWTIENWMTTRVPLYLPRPIETTYTCTTPNIQDEAISNY